MSSSPSRYRPDDASDYSHRFHAGNVGDVWKHCVLVEVLRRAAAENRVVAYVESHAGEGGYPLGPTGEWTEGIGRLWRAAGDLAAEDAAGRYLRLSRALASPDRYPGSPLLARAALPETATLALWESDAAASARLAAALALPAPRVAITCGDGLAALPAAVAEAEAHGARVVALVDPPFTRKPDWIAVPDAVIAAAARAPRATLLLWYPLKSLTRPNAMIARFKAAGVAASVAELVTTPLEHQRSRLNGSGLVLVRPPDGALAAIAKAAPLLGARLATRPGVWSLRLASW
ncbi:MAG: 23S rRNA (adenine(2030)-N(6))-methyltransferase RlmJ [Deltaproteobacteria bacterium]|nr:23S rRNA (adenine(2030)-N(6))-methyltransferase RlmJ [Deltaproteobacteria bacterium]